MAKQKLKIKATKGTMAQCLGVSDNLSNAIDQHVMQMMDSKKTMMEIIVSVEQAFDLNHNEWSAFMFSMGYWQCSINNSRRHG